jgi:hypothetical protein
MGSKVVQKRFSKVVENRGSCFPTPYYFFVFLAADAAALPAT